MCGWKNQPRIAGKDESFKSLRLTKSWFVWLPYRCSGKQRPIFGDRSRIQRLTFYVGSFPRELGNITTVHVTTPQSCWCFHFSKIHPRLEETSSPIRRSALPPIGSSLWFLAQISSWTKAFWGIGDFGNLQTFREVYIFMWCFCRVLAKEHTFLLTKWNVIFWIYIYIRILTVIILYLYIYNILYLRSTALKLFNCIRQKHQGTALLTSKPMAASQSCTE